MLIYTSPLAVRFIVVNEVFNIHLITNNVKLNFTMYKDLNYSYSRRRVVVPVQLY